MVTLSNGLWLDFEHCQAVTMPRVTAAALNLPQSIAGHVWYVLYVLFWGVLISSDGGV